MLQEYTTHTCVYPDKLSRELTLENMLGTLGSWYDVGVEILKYNNIYLY